MDTVNLDDTTLSLSDLVERAAGGEEILIAKDGHPMARLVPCARPREPRPLDLLAGQVWVGPDFDDPLPEEILAAFEGRGP